MKTTKTKNYNIAKYLPEMAQKRPFDKAVIFPGKKDNNGKRNYTHFTYKQLDQTCNRYAHAMQNHGISKGTKVLLMVKPSLNFIALTFALFKIQAVPILIDPGMGRKRLLDCIKNVSPDAVVGIPLVHGVRLMFPSYFTSVTCNIVVDGSFSFLGHDLESISKNCSEQFTIKDTLKTDPAAILFTSGSTGPAKGVLYEHGMFDSQVRLLKKLYGFKENEVDLACLPVFALFDVAFGMTCIIPDMDATKPAEVNPANIIEAINDHGVTTSFGSPAIWKTVSSYCLSNCIKLPSIKRILMAGAPVPGDLILKFSEILINGDIYTPYGATESLPVASTSGKEVISETYKQSKLGMGTCVGYAAPEVEIKIISITDDVIIDINDVSELEKDKIGEIIVSGPSVTKEYFERPKDTALSKIMDGKTLWHRIGDTGYLDSDGKLWFCGRKNHRLTTTDGEMYTVPCESIFNLHPKVFRSALVGLGIKGNHEPVIIIEPKPDKFPYNSTERNTFIEELLDISSKFDHCTSIKKILFHKSFPVDIRHNAKIFREKLTIWAQEQY
ncbi:AMP-binding protein [bacterium]|nr:AMP-binding protein [bacterium]